MSLVELLPDDFHDREAYVARLLEIYGEQTVTTILQDARHTRSGVCYWQNPLCLTDVGLELPLWREDKQVAGLPELFVSTTRDRITHSKPAELGQIYVQNPSSYLAVQQLDPKPGEEVLDLAAAPGGKTIGLAVAMRNQGRLAAVEPVARRYHRLKANVERCGVSIVAFYQRDGRGVGRAVGERFDRVLLDAPCSSESRMRWDRPSSYQYWQLRKVKEVARKQKSLLRSGYASLKPGGTLLYCTCSLNLEENELVVEHLLRKTDAYLQPFELPHGLDKGLFQSGRDQNRKKPLHASMQHTLRIVPQGVWDGFFMARLKKPAATT